MVDAEIDSLNVVFYSTRSFKDEIISLGEIENIEPNLSPPKKLSSGLR